MLTVEGLIGDLLVQYNCVVVPSFGGFVTQRVPAQIDTTSGIIQPPKKSVLFNKQLINNDGLLIAAFAQRAAVPYTQAQEIVAETIGKWEQELRNGNRISIDKVGHLFNDQERNLCFEQDRFYNLLLESYGLGPIRFVSAADVEAKESRAVVQELLKEAELAPTPELTLVDFPESMTIEPVAITAEEAPIIALTEKSATKTWRYIAAACLVPVAFYSFWIPAKTDVLESGIISINDFNPFHKKVESKYVPAKKKYTYEVKTSEPQLKDLPANGKTFSYEVDEDTYVPVDLQQTAESVEPIKDASVNNTPLPLSKPVKNTATSHVIVGAFSERANAEELVTLLKGKGYNAQILPGNGMIRVSAGNGADFSTLSAKLKAEGLSPWLLK